jgi:hypothetical protein
MRLTTLNAACKTQGCPKLLLVAPPILPGEYKSLFCTRCCQRHEYGAEDVHESGTKLEVRIGRQTSK